MDALSEVLRSIRVEGAMYLNAEFTAPWCVLSSFAPLSLREKLARAEECLFFHFITEGACKLRIDSVGSDIDAVAGDVILFPRNERHLMGSDLRLAPVEAANIAPEVSCGDGEFVHMRHGGGGEATRFVCGYLACNSLVSRPLIESVPRVIKMSVGDGVASVLMRELLRVAVRESLALRPGAGSTLAKISELMFVEAMRRHINTLPPERQGWLAGMRDPKVGRALALLHSDPSRAWTVDSLASEVAVSRSAFAKRFTSLVGESPMQYLLRWRLTLAANMLRSTQDPIARVAARNGYESEEAFIRAFKREFGAPPATWRREAGDANAM